MPETIFKKVDYQLSNLVDNIELGEIGLPDIQRPFVWDAAKVRDLFDSMYRGYPVGHLLFWESGAEPGARQIGAHSKQLAPKLLIVDGQQRLTSLFAVIKRHEVVGKDYVRRRINIAFRRRHHRQRPDLPGRHRRDLGALLLRRDHRLPAAPR